jgi:hypothetical protein
MTGRNLGVLAACAALCFVAVGLYWHLGDQGEPAFRRALDNAAKVRTIHCRITRGDETFEVWAEQPGRLRRNAPDGTYQIARDGKMWQVDEKANRATVQTSPYHHENKNHELDLLTLLPLQVPLGSRHLLVDKLPEGHVEHGGRDCLVYRADIPGEDGNVQLEALVDRATGLPQVVQARGVRDGAAFVLAELEVLGYDEAVPADKFVVRDTLTEDGRVGKITDLQGVVSVKPVMHERWTPVSGPLPLKPGDYVQTDVRGANAGTLRLVKRTRVILGPGTLVEVIKPDQLRLVHGQLEVSAAEGTTLEIQGPGKDKIEVKGTKHYRVDKEKLVAVVQEPRWLKAYKGTNATESLGSLIAGVDGRNVPLTVGEHKVTVDVRDQIARTMIEETFVNHTNGLLEGVFHFPLPPGASVSGFAMWIGNNMVEADVVEKQRAREIYETILHEKRDPGLLEWSGGNIFKARVYPIFPNSEKRIRITYTQVLPLKNGRYSYSYALQSELLQQHPLRELAIDVKVNSALPLKSVTCPTHAARLGKTAHSAHVEFTAQEYTPTRDFEVVIETDGQQGATDAVLIPHRRGDDGYFMLQLTPPGVNAAERNVLPDGKPLNLLVLADTSASMDAGQRTVAQTFLSALLNGLTPGDTINVATCDVECDWIFEKGVPATSANIAAVREVLAKRTSLGWTDLDRAFASALQRSGLDTHVIYIGDGIVTAGDGDPAAFAKRLRRLYEEKGKPGTFHAVTTGSSFETSVLQTVAFLGSGSLRHIGGEQGPAAVALDLLGELTQPPVRDLKVEFRGLRTASVYPDRLPNLSAGSQQILLGRYLPEGRDQVGEVIVTGNRGGQPVRFTARVALEDAEKGNSFIPRLWARMYLDHLLAQGSTPAGRDEIIALSEEYNILTPYTSLLVLESDADRERFKVKTRFRMRDGEKFFAQGRDNANYELKQQQMKRAGDWRVGLRKRILAQLGGLGRDLRRLQRDLGAYLGDSREKDSLGRFPASMPVGASAPQSGEYYDWGGGNLPALVDAEEAAPVADAKAERKDGKSSDKSELGLEDTKKDDPDDDVPFDDGDEAGRSKGGEMRSGGLRQSERDLKRLESAPEFGYFGNLAGGLFPSRERARRIRSLAALFPTLPRTPGKRTKPAWPAAARTLAESLLRGDRLAKMQGGLDVVLQTEVFDARWAELTSRSGSRTLLSAGAWLMRSDGDELVQWCDGRERGVFTAAFLLGRVRPAAAGDLGAVPLDMGDYSITGLEKTYGHYTATVEPAKEGQSVLLFTYPSDRRYQTRVVVDTARHVVVRIEQQQDGKTKSVTKFEDFVEAGGSWWARRIETVDDQGRLTSRTTLTLQPVAADEVAKRLKDGLTGRDAVLFLTEPLRDVASAKKALAGGKPTFDDHFALLLHFAAGQQWTRAAEHLQKCEALAADKPGLRWLHNEFLQASRRHEELRQRVLEDAGRLAKAEPVLTGELAVAEYLLTQARWLLEANEQLALVDLLKPVYERAAQRAGHKQSLKQWAQYRLGALRQTGQHDEVRRLLKQQAVDYPHDVDLQLQYAQDLAQGGDYPAAHAWVVRVLAGEARWLPSEDEALRNSQASWLETQGRYADLADHLAAWIKKDPVSASPYAQYLSALVRTDRVEKAHGLIAQWLREGQGGDPPGTLSLAQAARLQAALSHALGQGHNVRSNHIDGRWLKPLADAALFFAPYEARSHDTSLILSSYQFRQTDEWSRVHKALVARLVADLATMNPERIQAYLHWLVSNEPGVDQATWKRIAAGLKERWTAEANVERKHTLGQAIVTVLARLDDPTAMVAFQHARTQKPAEQYRATYARDLFDTLLGQPWSAEYEDEAFALLDQLSDAENPADRLAAQVTALHQLTDRMLEGRRQARMKAVEHPEKLTRIELTKKQDEALKLARIGLADRLRAEAGKQRGPLGVWLEIEQLYLDARLERDIDKVAAACWKHLGAEPKKAPEATEENESARLLEEVLHDRHLLTVMHLAVRKGADKVEIDRVLKYVERGAALEEEPGRWKQFHYWMLVALDRPKDIEKVLQTWVQAGDTDNRWRLALGYVLAEQGRVPEAIALFEAIEKADELSPADYRALANWYLAADRRAQHDRAQIASYRITNEWQLARSLNARVRPWQQEGGHPPTEVDKDILFQFAALFEKSSTPHNHLGLLREYYQVTRDFRLLTGFADAVVGHSAAGVYPFLSQAQSVISDVGDEATVDELAAHLAKVRARAKTDVDRRALDLLEMLVRRRAAELKNQAGSHAEAALAALQRSFKGEWSPGEPSLVADVLASLGAMPQQPLAREQLRQLQVLHAREKKGTFDRLHIAHRLAQAQVGYLQRDQAIALLDSALTEYQEAHAGKLPPDANAPLDTLVSIHAGARRHDRGEKILLEQLRHPVHEQQRNWLILRLDQLYHDALIHDGTVSLGSGVQLYQAVERKLRGDLATPDHNHRRNVIDLLCRFYTTAAEKKLPGAHEDLKAFGRLHLPEVLKVQTNNYQNIINQVASTIRTVIGPRDAIEFLLDRIEREPGWFKYSGEDGWGQFGWTIAQWRAEAKGIGELDARVLPLVLADLRRDLETGQYRYRALSSRQNSYYWEEKETEFARVAEDVLSKRQGLGSGTRYIADYFYHGLHRYNRAIEVLAAAHKAKLLDDAGQVQLVNYLHWQNRHAESIPLLEPLVERTPADLSYRVLLMNAYFHANRSNDLLALLKRTDAFWHEKDRWTEHAMVALGASCLENQLYAQSAAYYNEAIPLHQRTHPHRGIGNGTLSDYYAHLARAYSGQGKTAEGVDAASAAVVSWGSMQHNRTQALESLRQVLRDSANLDGYVTALDKQTAASGLDSAVIRKALGQVYLEKRAFAKAITQFGQAISLQPNDAETHKLLIDCHDKQGNNPGAILALLDAVQLLRRDIALYEQLGHRLGKEPKEAERAYTSIVEVLPAESESHALLAEVRQKQGRWPEAIVQWEHVARIRELEPTGLLKLAEAQIHEGQWDRVAQTVRKLKARTWPARFNTVGADVRKLEEQVKLRKGDL